MEIKSLKGPSSFLDIVGNSPRNRILDFLMGEIGYDFTLKEIAEKSNVGYATIKRIWNSFTKANLVKPTRRIGKAILYTYDNKSHNGKILRMFYIETIFKEAKKQVKTIHA